MTSDDFFARHDLRRKSGGQQLDVATARGSCSQPIDETKTRALALAFAGRALTAALAGKRIASAIDILQVLRHAMLSTPANSDQMAAADCSFDACDSAPEQLW
jgi:hypothetical protein